jgi:hypothetical protein
MAHWEAGAEQKVNQIAVQLCIVCADDAGAKPISRPRRSWVVSMRMPTGLYVATAGLGLFVGRTPGVARGIEILVIVPAVNKVRLPQAAHSRK